MLKKCRLWHVRTRLSLANTLTTWITHVSFPFWLWYIISKDYMYSFAFLEYYQWLFFSLDIKIYLYHNISTHSVTESKTRHLVIVFILLQRHSVTWQLLASTTRRVEKQVSFLLIYPKCVLLKSWPHYCVIWNDLSVTGVIQITTLRCVKLKRTMLSNVLTAKAISRALLSSYLTRYIKNIYSVTISQRSVPFRNGVVYMFCVMDSLIIHFGIKNTN